MEGFQGGGFSMVGIYAFTGGIAAMCMVLLAVTAFQKWSNVQKMAEAKKAAEAMPPAQTSALPSV